MSLHLSQDLNDTYIKNPNPAVGQETGAASLIHMFNSDSQEGSLLVPTLPYSGYFYIQPCVFAKGTLRP